MHVRTNVPPPGQTPLTVTLTDEQANVLTALAYLTHASARPDSPRPRRLRGTATARQIASAAAKTSARDWTARTVACGPLTQLARLGLVTSTPCYSGSHSQGRVHMYRPTKTGVAVAAQLEEEGQRDA